MCVKREGGVEERTYFYVIVYEDVDVFENQIVERGRRKCYLVTQE